MPLNARIADAIRSQEHAPPRDSLSIGELRKVLKETYNTGVPKTSLDSPIDLCFFGPSGKVPLRVYIPYGEGPFPVTMFFHGGGFCLHDLDTHDALCREICSRSNCVVVSVDYRLAPEAKFPAGIDDCIAAVRWFASHGGKFNCDTSRLAVAGDSSGGCIAAVTAIRLRDERGPSLSGQLLFYPITDHYSAKWPSYKIYKEGYGLTDKLMMYYWDLYLPLDASPHDPMVSPLRSLSFADLPPTLIQSAEYDVLRDEAEAYAVGLKGHGVTTRLERCRGLNHGFLRWIGIIPEVDFRLQQACNWLKETLRSADLK